MKMRNREASAPFFRDLHAVLAATHASLSEPGLRPLADALLPPTALEMGVALSGDLLMAQCWCVCHTKSCQTTPPERTRRALLADALLLPAALEMGVALHSDLVMGQCWLQLPEVHFRQGPRHESNISNTRRGHIESRVIPLVIAIAIAIAIAGTRCRASRRSSRMRRRCGRSRTTNRSGRSQTAARMTPLLTKVRRDRESRAVGVEGFRICFRVEERLSRMTLRCAAAVLPPQYRGDSGHRSLGNAGCFLLHRLRIERCL